MLVLSRKIGERVVIGDDVTVQVVEVKRGKVRLAIQAPQEVQVMREELLQRKAVEGERSLLDSRPGRE